MSAIAYAQDKTVGVMSHDDSSRVIDCYSVSKNTNITADASYIATPAPSADWTDVEDAIPTTLIPALEWLVAARTFGARGDSNHAAICQQNEQNLLV